eukprot:6192669-Amphidinium_carterae.1
MKTTMIWTKLTSNDFSMTSEFSLEDVLEMTRDFTVELKIIVQRKRQTAAVHYSLHTAAIQDAEPEEGDEDPTECGLSRPTKKGGTKKKPTPPRPTNVCAAYQSDKGRPEGGGCHTVKKLPNNNKKSKKSIPKEKILKKPMKIPMPLVSKVRVILKAKAKMAKVEVEEVDQ